MYREPIVASFISLTIMDRIYVVMDIDLQTIVEQSGEYCLDLLHVQYM